jgi:hypothetical protein
MLPHLNKRKKNYKVIDKSKLPNPLEYYQNNGFQLQGTSQWRSTLCPFHHDTNPSLRVNTLSGGFICMACGEKGDLISFHQKRNNLSFKETCIALGIWS